MSSRKGETPPSAAAKKHDESQAKAKKALERRATDARSVRSKQIVLAAATDLFVKEGYAGFSINAVVRQTGIAKTTIYRHWPTQAQLLTDVIEQLSLQHQIPNCGSLQADLVEFYRYFSGTIFNDSKQSALLGIPALLETAQNEPGLEHIVKFAMTGMVKAFHTMLERGRDRGEVRLDRDIDTMAYILYGALNIRRGFFSEEMTEAEIVTIITTVLEGIAPRPA